MSELLDNLPPEDSKPKKKEVILTDSQKARILEMLMENPEKPPKIKDVIKDPGVFNKEIDAREMEGLAVRKFIAEKGLSYHKARDWIPVKIIVLTEEQKQFISNNLGTMKPLEMARTLFNNPELTNLSAETVAIYEFIKTIPSTVANSIVKTENLATDDYRPPKTEDQAISRINKYVNNANLIKEKLTEKQKRDIKSTIGYCHTMRYITQINTYFKEEERMLFESEFLRCVYDKSLNEEEVSQYIIYCSEVVIAKQIAKRIQDLESAQDDQMAENNNRPNMALVESISSMRQEYNQCITRQRALLKTLQGERKERLRSDGKSNENLLDLIMFWQSAEKRQHLLNLKRLRDAKLKDEIKRLQTMDAIKGEIFGIHDEEIMD